MKLIPQNAITQMQLCTAIFLLLTVCNNTVVESAGNPEEIATVTIPDSKAQLQWAKGYGLLTANMLLKAY